MNTTEKRQQLRGGAPPPEEPATPQEEFTTPPDDSTPEDEPPPIELLPDGTAVVRLTKPLMPHPGKGEDPLADLTEIRLRPMYARDMLVLDDAEGDITKVIALAKKVSGLPQVAFERLHAHDFARVHGIIQGRLGNFLGTSKPLWALSLV